LKRQQREKPNASKGKLPAIDPRRLTGARGGRGLGIAIAELGPLPPEMPNQHNEALVSLQD
jgi:hypothetical protein